MATILVLGGLVGFVQLAVGDYVVTGSLPAKGPIVGVAAITYSASIILGGAILGRRAWLATVNFALIVGIVYLAAYPRPLALVLGLLHLVAAVILVAARPWFRGPAGRRP